MIELALYIVAFCIVAWSALLALSVFVGFMHFMYSVVTGRR